jgi:hypothetical protein
VATTAVAALVCLLVADPLRGVTADRVSRRADRPGPRPPRCEWGEGVLRPVAVMAAGPALAGVRCLADSPWLVALRELAPLLRARFA